LPEAAALNGMLALRVALDLDMNLSPVNIENTHGDGARRPIYVADKLNRASRVPASANS
jgi:hypothetical protein